MWARVARFEGDPADVDGRVERLRSMLESDGIPPELADARILLLVDRASGGALGVTLFESEEAMRRGDEVMNAGQGHAGARSSVEFYEHSRTLGHVSHAPLGRDTRRDRPLRRQPPAS